ncbi:hypothetical protein SIN_0533 [Streptococcus infantis SK1302]|uniref:Uncharacterized protein n=1 Tax=Streptococcus infantis SK1302 TaxID=871237 RepID=A0ABP2JCL3_9STRE|nr:hypothetical protein SIN_0533 [Streptococcus infantis SK1302]
MKSFSKELFEIEKPNQSQYQKLIASKKNEVGIFIPASFFVFRDFFSF